jgi:ATP-binding cassette subfamily F protein uup
LTTFDCGFKDYLVRKDNLLNSENIANQKFEKKLAQEEIWIRQGIKARRTRNEGRVRALKEMRKQFINKRTKQGTVKIQDINEDVKRNSKLVFELKNISYSFNDNQLIQDFSQIILKGEKIGIIGGNGVGKTTLIKLLLDQLVPTKGSIRRSKNIELAYFDQINESFKPEMKAMDFVSGGKEYIDIGGKNKHIIGYLRQFLFTGKQAMSPIRMFSGGEKNRLLLAKILSKPANLVILDEPTNDLDVETLELLEEMLVEYKGTLIVISHDRTFLNNVVSSTIVMNGDADIKHYAGGYDDYLQSTNKAKNQSQVIIKSSPSKKKIDDILSRDERKELGRLPKLIEKKEIEIGQLQLKLSDTNAYKDKMYKKNIGELSALEDELNFLYDRWSELEKRN